MDHELVAESRSELTDLPEKSEVIAESRSNWSDLRTRPDVIVERVSKLPDFSNHPEIILESISNLSDFPKSPDVISISSEGEMEYQPIKGLISISYESSDEIKFQEFDQIISTQNKSLNITLHNNKIPIYARPDKSLEATQIFRLCFGEISDNYISNSKPVSVDTNQYL